MDEPSVWMRSFVAPVEIALSERHNHFTMMN